MEHYVMLRTTSAHWRIPPVERIVSAHLLELFWQKIAVDYFEINSKQYVVVVDYFSHYIELIKLHS